MTWPIWLTAAALYALFLGWYNNWRGALTAAEIDQYLARAAAQGMDELNDIGIVRRFLEADDGREFIMVNLVRYAPGPIPHPETGAPTDGAALMQIYARTFVRGLLRYGGHPALATRKVAGYVDAWQVPPDPGWSVVGFMRYRSRRDMIKMATDPSFKNIHKFKVAGVAETFSFPTQTFLRLFVGPRFWLALLLALGAALAQIAVLLPKS